MISRVKQAPTKSQINGYTSAQVYQGREHVEVTQRAVLQYIPGIYLVYIRHFAPAAHVLARFVSQPLLAASYLDTLRIS